MALSYSFYYHGGLYKGKAKRVKTKPKNKGKPLAKRYKMIPDGAGTYSYGGVTFKGIFKNGYESKGTITWPNGATFTGNFINGFPEPCVLRSHHQNAELKKQITKLRADVSAKQSEAQSLKEDVELEQESSMAIALALDRCQTKLQRVYEFAASQEGMDIAQLNSLRFA